jgi:AraC-like DNA-binding protein
MISQQIDNKRSSPKVLVENKVTFAGPESELSIYDTYERAERVQLKSDQLLFCAMVTGKKVMHSEEEHFNSEFLPHESFVMAPESIVEIDFPTAQLAKPTTCLAIEISTDRIKQVASSLNENMPINQVFGHWKYNDQLVHTHHNSQTQGLLNRIVQMYSENHQDRSAMISLAVSELTIRLLRHQTRDFMLSFCQQQPDNNSLTATVSYIKENLAENFNIDVLARIACMGRTKFFNEFRLHFGCSPLVFQQQLRLKQAAVLIKKGQQITQTCFELGFNNASHFSRCFKLFYGVTPRQYKLRHQTNYITREKSFL